MIKYALLLLLVISCSSTRSPDYSLQGKHYKSDLVSVQTAINLAMSSYIKGCVEQKNSFHNCQKEAKKYVQENIISIMDQGKSHK